MEGQDGGNIGHRAGVCWHITRRNLYKTRHFVPEWNRTTMSSTLFGGYPWNVSRIWNTMLLIHGCSMSTIHSQKSIVVTKGNTMAFMKTYCEKHWVRAGTDGSRGQTQVKYAFKFQGAFFLKVLKEGNTSCAFPCMRLQQMAGWNNINVTRTNKSLPNQIHTDINTWLGFASLVVALLIQAHMSDPTKSLS